MTERPTPETDAACHETYARGIAHIPLVGFMERLERERDEARAQLAAERALADRLAGQLEDCLQSQEDIGWVMQALAAWREARATPAEKKSDFS